MKPIHVGVFPSLLESKKKNNKEALEWGINKDGYLSGGLYEDNPSQSNNYSILRY